MTEGSSLRMNPEYAPPPGPPGHPVPLRPKVLLVEDNADMRAYLRRHLSRDFEVLEASRGDEGLKSVQCALPSIVVSDIMMPGLDGYALCQAVKSDPEINFIPVILLTAKTGQQSKLTGLEHGADEYIAKPFDPAELLLRIRNLLQAQRRTIARFAASTGVPSLEAGSAQLPPAHRAFSDRVQTVLNRESHDEAFDVTALAARLNMSRAQLYRRLSEACGQPPAEVIVRFRLERAARMLRQKAGNVSEVAYAVGFRDLSHFVRRFRERYGLTPGAYADRERDTGSEPQRPSQPV